MSEGCENSAGWICRLGGQVGRFARRGCWLVWLSSPISKNITKRPEHGPPGGKKAGPGSWLAHDAQRGGPFLPRQMTNFLASDPWQFPRRAMSATLHADSRRALD